MKAIRISLEDIKEKEYSSEVISMMKEKIFPDNAGNGMPSKQHWFTKQVSKMEKYFYINEETQTYYFTIVKKDYEIRELTLSKDNWNRYNHILDVLSCDPNNTYFELDKEDKSECFDNVYENDDNHILDVLSYDPNNTFELDKEDKELVLEDLHKHLSECFDNVYENDDNLVNEEELVGNEVIGFLGYQDVKNAVGYNIVIYEKALYGFYGICIEEFLEDKNDFDTLEWLEELFTNEEEAIDFAISYIKENY